MGVVATKQPQIPAVVTTSPPGQSACEYVTPKMLTAPSHSPKPHETALPALDSCVQMGAGRGAGDISMIGCCATGPALVLIWVMVRF